MNLLKKIINVFGLKRALSFIWQSLPELTVINTFVIVLQGTLPLASLYLIKLIIDSMTVGMNSANKETIFRSTIFLIFLLAGVVFLTYLTNLEADFIKEAQSIRVIDYILGAYPKT